MAYYNQSNSFYGSHQWHRVMLLQWRLLIITITWIFVSKENNRNPATVDCRWLSNPFLTSSQPQTKPKTIKNETILSLVLEIQFLSVGRLHDKKKPTYQNILETSAMVDMEYTHGLCSHRISLRYVLRSSAKSYVTLRCWWRHIKPTLLTPIHRSGCFGCLHKQRESRAFKLEFRGVFSIRLK